MGDLLSFYIFLLRSLVHLRYLAIFVLLLVSLTFFLTLNSILKLLQTKGEIERERERTMASDQFEPIVPGERMLPSLPLPIARPFWSSSSLCPFKLHLNCRSCTVLLSLFIFWGCTHIFPFPLSLIAHHLRVHCLTNLRWLQYFLFVFHRFTRSLRPDS